MIPRIAVLFALCAGTDVQVVDMYRGMKKPNGGKEAHPISNSNLADIQGVLRYIHQEVIVEHAQGDPARTVRKYGIDSIGRYRVKVKNPSSAEASAPIPGFGAKFSAFDYGVATNNDALEELAKGDFVGIQTHTDAVIITTYPYYWFSLPGYCPNLPWTCIYGNKQSACKTKQSDVGVMPAVCATGGCAGKNDKSAQECAANLSLPDSMSSCCLRYTVDKAEDVIIKGGLCNSSDTPTGEPGCVYAYESLEEKDFLSLDDLVGITAAKCGNSGERACTDWADWRKNCYDPDKKYKKRFKKTDNSDGTMKVDVEETDYCVEYDLHPYCQDKPPDLCNNVDCQNLSPSEREIGLEFWLGRCEEGPNTKRAEGIVSAFVKSAPKSHLMIDKELMDSNFKCISGGNTCKPNTNGGPYCTRQYGGVCTPCYIPGTETAFGNANFTPTCPFNILAEGGYTPPQGTQCKSNNAEDICCLYNVNGPCSKSYADGSSVELSIAGFMGVMAASLQDPDQMFKFAVHWIEENGGTVEKEDQLKDEVYWLWRVNPPKKYDEAWKSFQASLKASTAVKFDGSGTSQKPGTTEGPQPGGDSTTGEPDKPGKKSGMPFPVWIVALAIGAAAFLAAVWNLKEFQSQNHCAIGAIHIERKWGRHASAASHRRETAQEVLEATDHQKVCSKRRFPKRIRHRQKRDTMRVSFVDENEPEVNGGFRYRDVTENMEVVIDGLVRHCERILPQLHNELLTRAYRFTEDADEFRVSTAFTDRWVCHRATGLCPNDEFPEKDEDEPDDVDDEL